MVLLLQKKILQRSIKIYFFVCGYKIYLSQQQPLNDFKLHYPNQNELYCRCLHIQGNLLSCFCLLPQCNRMTVTEQKQQVVRVLFCHFGLVGHSMGFVTEHWHSCHVLFLTSSVLEPCAFSSVLPCFVLEHGVSDPGSHCVSMRSRVRLAARSSVHVCFVLLHAFHVFIGCVHSCFVLGYVARSLYFHWLRAFMLSCLV